MQVEKQHLQQQNKTLVQSLEAVVQHKLAPHKQVDLKTPVDETLDILQSYYGKMNKGLPCCGGLGRSAKYVQAFTGALSF